VKKPDKNSIFFKIPVLHNAVVISIVILLVMSSVGALSLHPDAKDSVSINHSEGTENENNVNSDDNTHMNQQDTTESVVDISSQNAIVPPLNAPRDSAWSAQLDFHETTGRSDYVIFGEAPDASDDKDSYDTPNPPSSPDPYLDAYFSTPLTWPYDILMKDIKQSPAEEKIWDLHINCSLSIPPVQDTTITITWNTDEVNTSGYETIVLCDDNGGILQNMKENHVHSFNTLEPTLQHFKIICSNNIPLIIYVDDNNTAGPWDGTLAYPYRRIQQGINNASNGDTIFVFNGTYVENVKVNKSLTLKGENKNTTIVVGNGLDVFYITVDRVNISGFTVRNGGSGMKIFSSNTCISNNNIISNSAIGVLIDTQNNNTIKCNYISNNGGGIWIETSLNNTIVNNTITHNPGIGIVLLGGDNTSVSGNTITFNSLNGTAGGFLLDYADNNTIINNNISNNGQNEYTHQSYGIGLIYGSCFNEISGNIIASNQGHGLNMFSDSYNNLIYNNYFDNPNNVFSRHFGWPDLNNTWNITKTAGKNIIGGLYLGGNYWSNYTGVDWNGDGLGDTNLPYNNSGGIMSGGDYLPLVFSNQPPVHNLNTSEDFLTIQGAINDNDTQNGNTIFVDNGTYYEHVSLTKSLTLIGENRTSTIIDGTGSEQTVVVRAPHCTITSFTIQNCSRIGGPIYAEVYIDASYTLLSHNIIQGFERGAGIYIVYKSNIVIEDNIIIHNLFGIVSQNSRFSTISFNNISYNYIGIVLRNSPNNIILNNIFYRNTHDYGSKQGKNNNISSAILLDNTTSAQIFLNTFTTNDYGIYSFNLSINNTIYHNNFINNNHSAYDNSTNNWYDPINNSGNYWSDFPTNPGYPIYYQIPGGSNRDNYPYKTPNGWDLPIVCGDATNNGVVDVSDVVYLINYLFIHGPEPVPQLCAGDANGDGIVDISDVVYLINYLFIQGPAPGGCCGGSA
jgi:parallel beta-helix repeat protein